MLMVYSGDPLLFSLNSFSSGHRQDAQQQQMRRTQVEGFFFIQTPATAHTMHILGKAEQLHHIVMGQLTGRHMSRTGIARAGIHVAPVLPGGVDTGVPYLQEEAFLDAVEDAVGVVNLGRKGQNLKMTDTSSGRVSPHTTTYLLLIQQTISRWETDVMVGFQFRGLAVVVELKTWRPHGGLQHFSFSVVDGDLQVKDVRRHKWKHGLWRIHYPTKHTGQP